MSLHDDFPNLAGEGFVETSPATGDYNCIAWAAGVQDDWWWPDPGLVSYWPHNVPRAETLSAFQAALTSLGYQHCAEGDAETGFEKVAFYLRGGKPAHMARQMADGSWTSKLGPAIDITHTLHGLEGPE